jgi:hypothetical protein
MSARNTRTGYGLFYKSHGQWVGPYRNQVIPSSKYNSFVANTVPALKTLLKSKVSVRRVTTTN